MTLTAIACQKVYEDGWHAQEEGRPNPAPGIDMNYETMRIWLAGWRDAESYYSTVYKDRAGEGER